MTSAYCVCFPTITSFVLSFFFTFDYRLVAYGSNRIFRYLIWKHEKRLISHSLKTPKERCTDVKKKSFIRRCVPVLVGSGVFGLFIVSRVHPDYRKPGKEAAKWEVSILGICIRSLIFPYLVKNIKKHNFNCCWAQLHVIQFFFQWKGVQVVRTMVNKGGPYCFIIVSIFYINYSLIKFWKAFCCIFLPFY